MTAYPEARTLVVKRRSGIGAFIHYMVENWMLLLLALPGIALIFVFRYIPLFGLVVAFEDFSPKTGFFSPWVGLSNFRLLWQSPVLGRLIKNTLLLNFMAIVATTFSSVTIALLLNEVRSRLFKSVTQSIMFLPFFMGWTLVAMVLYGLIDYQVGTINVFLARLGLERVSITARPELWPWILTAIKVWKGTGSGCILYLAVLVGVDPQLYEASAIDGAGRLQRMWFISLPTLVPTIIMLTLLAIGRIFFGDFGMIYAIVGDRAMLYPTTDVIDTYIVRALRQNVNWGMTTAVGWTQSILGFICVLGSNMLVKWWSHRRDEEYELF